MPSRNIHLVGSVPLANAREVFETVSAALGPRLKRIPDGETGERSDWIAHLEPVFANHPALEKSDEVFRLARRPAPGRTRYDSSPASRSADVTFDNLFYADIAIRSYRDFASLKQQGKIPARCRFQVDLVPAHSVIWLFLQDDLHPAVDPIYNEAVRREIDKLAAAIPHGELAIQFDVASAVFARLQRDEPNAYGRNKSEMHDDLRRILAKLANHVPADIELLFHFCYGDSNHRHVVEPTDMGDMVELANRLARGIDALDRSGPHAGAARPLRRAYFEPLRRLKLTPGTELCLGLVHYTDGIAGTRRRLATAEKYVQNFSIATECGFGRRPPDTIPELLRNPRRCGGVALAAASGSRVAHGRSQCDDPPDPADERADWEPLWKGYWPSTRSSISDETTAVTWARLHDPAEPMERARRLSGRQALRHRALPLPPLVLDDRRLLLSPGSVRRRRRAQSRARTRADRRWKRGARRGASRVYWLTHETNTDARALYDRLAERSGFIQYRKLF